MGAYGALVYLCTVAGGWLADRVLGAERTLLGGTLLLVAGHASLSAVPGGTGVALGMVLVAVGSGSLKTAAITVLGHVFGQDEQGRRDAGFQFFYLGINVGALLGPLLTGWLAQHRGYPAGFGAAAALMVIGLLGYLALRGRYLAQLGAERRHVVTRPGNPAPPGDVIRMALTAAAVLAVLLGAVVSRLINLADLATILLAVTMTLVVALFWQMLRSARVSTPERTRVKTFIPLFIASSGFWSILNQTYGVLAVYSDVRLDRGIGNWVMPAAWTQSFNPAYILLLSAPMALLWRRLGNRVDSASKMSVGVVISGFGMLVLLPFAGGGEASTPVLALAAAVLVITTGELLVGPVGMAATAAHAPAAYRARFSSLYFLSMALGTALAGVLSRFYDPLDAATETRYFLACGAGAIIVGLGSLLAVRWLAGRARGMSTPPMEQPAGA